MTTRPPTHREPTDEEMQCLPEGTLWLYNDDRLWSPCKTIGKSGNAALKHLYAVPITKREEAQEPRKTLRDEFAMAALIGIAQAIASASIHNTAQTPPDDRIANWAYGYADAMLAARNNQPEKV